MKDLLILSSVEEIKAYSDPYRMNILNCFYDLDEPATVKEIADKIGEEPAKVHYHVKKLEKNGLLILVKTKVINGIVAKYYEPTAKNINIENAKLDTAAEKIFKNEVEKVFHQYFEKAEETFLNTIRNLDFKEAKTKKNKANLSLESVYLSREEMEEFKDYIVNFIEEHSKKDDSKICFQIFNTIVNIGEK